MWFFKAILQLATLAIIASCQLVAASPPESAGHVEIPPNTSIESLLGHAQSHLSRGEAHEALAYYDAAVARHPFDYLTLFKRASAQLLLGKPSLAAHDFNRALELEPDFEGAHIQLAKIRIRLGDWEGAMDHYIRAHKAHDSPEILELNEAQGAAALADVAQSTAAWEECTRQANLAISVAPRSSSLRQIRAHCRLEMGEIEAAIVDLKHVLQLQPADTAGYVNMSAITMYGLADTQEAMALARQCLQSDPDSKPCRNLLTKEKAITNALDKVIRSIRKTPMTATRMLVGTADNSGLIPDVRRDMEELTRQGILPLLAPKKLYSRLVDLACQGYHETENKNAQGYCEESLELNPVSLYGLLYRAKVHIGNEAFDAAIELYEKALENHTQEGGLISRLMQEARISLRRSQSKDYYKVLGLSRDADDRQIKSAYRKLSKQYHPDKVISNGITKDEAEKKMAQINEAYEVLGDSELRARFDQGDDPNSQHGFDHRTDRRAHHFGPGDPFQNMFRSGEGIKFRAGRGGGFQHGFAFN